MTEMLEWLAGNIGTIVVAAVVLAVAGAVVISMIADRKKGKNACSSCGGGCAGCPMSGTCHSGKTANNVKSVKNAKSVKP